MLFSLTSGTDEQQGGVGGDTRWTAAESRETTSGWWETVSLISHSRYDIQGASHLAIGLNSMKTIEFSKKCVKPKSSTF